MLGYSLPSLILESLESRQGRRRGSLRRMVSRGSRTGTSFELGKMQSWVRRLL